MRQYLKVILYAIIAIPLVITPFTTFPQHFGKAFIFQILVDLGLLVWVISRWRNDVIIERKEKRLLLFFGISVAIMFVASLFGENFIRSFEGTYFRNNGLVLWLHLLAFFFILSQTIRSAGEWRRLLSGLVIIGTLVAAIGIGQRFFTIWPGLIEQNGRVASTIGNPIFLGAYLLFPLFFAWYLAAISPTRKEKIIWAVLSFINLAAIYFTESGGIFVSLFTGIFVLVAMMVIKNKISYLSKNPLVIVGLAIILVSSITLVIFKTKIIGTKWYANLHGEGGYNNALVVTWWTNLLNPIDRVANISFGSGTGQTRVWAWQMALEGIKVRPIFGWGVANFETVADRFYNPRFFEHSFAETVWDRPHNIYLEVAVEQGIVGLIVYLGLFAAAYILIARASNWTPITKGLTAGLLTAYLVQNFFSLDTISSLLALVVLLAFISSAEQFKESNLPPHLGLGVGVVGILLFSIYVWSIKPLWAAYYVNQTEVAVGQDGEAWEESALRVLNYRGLYADQFKLALARDILNWDGTNNLPYLDLKKGYYALLAGLAEAIKHRPEHFNYYYYLGQLYQIEAEHGDKSYFDKSVVMLEKAQALSPDRQATTFVLAKNYFLAGDFAKAKEVLSVIIGEYPNNTDANLYYGLVLSKLGERALAADAFIKVVEFNGWNGVTTRVPYMIGQIIQTDGEYHKLILYYRLLVDRNPNEPLWPLELAKAYYLDGQWPQAEATIAAMRQLAEGQGHDVDAVWNSFKSKIKYQKSK